MGSRELEIIFTLKSDRIFMKSEKVLFFVELVYKCDKEDKGQ